MRGGLRKILEQLCPADGGGLTDGQLLARFLDGREEAAFAALVRRHGPMVLGVCRRIVGNFHDAEDAFQAAFLILARKAASVLRREVLAGWLYRVAYRTALEAKAKASQRRARERQVEQMPHPEVAPAEAQDWRPLLDRELDALPQKYRVAILLCDLEGKTRREAARHLGLSEGTLSSQLARARRLLARRLGRHGLALSGGALAMTLADRASAAVPAALASSTVRAATLVAAGQAAAVATPAAALMNEVLKTMLLTKLKVMAATLMVLVLLGAGGLVYQAAGQAPVQGREAGKPRTELESLRHEIELLRFNLEVVLEKCRAQENELHALRDQVKVGQAKGAKADEALLARRLSLDLTGALPAAEGSKQALVFPMPAGEQQRQQMLGYLLALQQAQPGPVQEIEAALKTLQESPAKDKGQQRAVEALQRALKQLREQSKQPSKPASP
jgi:RNA polymerase sigma factor (sigma-70 family)